MASMPAKVKVVTRKGYSPDFSRAFEHFLLHTGGRGVIDELEEKLHLTPKQVQPSKDTLYRFGNTSAASTWCAARCTPTVIHSRCKHRACCAASATPQPPAPGALRALHQFTIRHHRSRREHRTCCEAMTKCLLPAPGAHASDAEP